MAKKEVQVQKFASKNIGNQRYMICRNSIPDGKYWNGKHCEEWSRVGINTTSVLCHKCSGRLASDPDIGNGYKPSGKPRGWQFMKEYVDAQGNVFYKGVEQPGLKGTLPATQIEPDQKKRLTKEERQELKDQILQQIVFVRGQLMKSKLKRDINSNKVQLRALERKLKKVK
jgi:hypothetical protein